MSKILRFLGRLTGLDAPAALLMKGMAEGGEAPLKQRGLQFSQRLMQACDVLGAKAESRWHFRFPEIRSLKWPLRAWIILLLAMTPSLLLFTRALRRLTHRRPRPVSHRLLPPPGDPKHP